MSVADIVNKLFDWSQDDEDYEYSEEDYDTEIENDFQPEADSHHQGRYEPNHSKNFNHSSAKSIKQMDNVVGMPGIVNGSAEVMVIEPYTFEEMPKVIDALRDRKSVVLNLENMDPQEAQRAVDFVAGGTYAMDGHNERVGDSIFLFTPSCVTVSNLSGLISGADDLSSARIRRPSVGGYVEPWGEQPRAVAQ